VLWSSDSMVVEVETGLAPGSHRCTGDSSLGPTEPTGYGMHSS
jgi:hypothetical protein